MCGIAGLVMHDGTTPEVAILDRFARALGHRGPDGEGKHLAGPVGMVMTRLAIIDLVTGDQPIYDPGGVALIANAGNLQLHRASRGTVGDTVYDEVGLRAATPSLSEKRPFLRQ